MTDQEILAYVKAGKIDAQSAGDFLLAVEDGICGFKASLHDACEIMRECIEKKKRFRCAFITGESYDEEHIGNTHIECWAE